MVLMIRVNSLPKIVYLHKTKKRNVIVQLVHCSLRPEPKKLKLKVGTHNLLIDTNFLFNIIRLFLFDFNKLNYLQYPFQAFILCKF